MSVTTTPQEDWPEWEQETAGGETLDQWDDSAESAGEPPDPVAAPPPQLDDPPDPLATLRDVERLQVWRTKPTWCRGLLTTVDLASDEEIDLGQLKEDWGGGQIQLRPMKHTPQGWKYARGAVSVQFTGPPRERGLPLGRDGEPRIIETTARPVAEPPGRALARPAGGGDGMALMAQLFDRIVDRLDRLEARVAVPAPVPPPHDPLAEVKRAGAMIRELRQLTGMFSGEPSEEPDEDEDEDEEDEGPPSPEAMLMRLLEKKLDDGGDARHHEAVEPSKKTGPRLIKAKASQPQRQPPPAPAKRPVEIIDVEPEAESVPAPSEVSPPTVEAALDPWSGTVAAELRGPSGSVASAAAPILEQLRAMPTHEALALLDGVVRSLPKEQVIGWIQAMQRAK